jgi:Rieske Fe-S protein
MTRRESLAKLAMGLGLLASYGTLAVQGVLFLLPKRLKGKTRLIFAGSASSYPVGGVQTVPDLEGNQILIKRTETGFKAYSSTCPHLGCHVHWESDKERFFCPCHNGVFNADGKAVAGPPADAGQSLSQVPLKVDEQSGVVYLEVKDPKRRSA